MCVIRWFETGFKSWRSFNAILAFVPFYLFLWPIAKLFKVNGFALSDLLSPCLCFFYGISHFGCMFAGCCHGFTWESGIFNPRLQQNTFPIQPIEALVSIGIAVFLVIKHHRHNYVADGLSFPLMLVLFGVSHFGLEFARDNVKILLGLSSLAFHSIFISFVGMISYLTITEINISNKKRNKYYNLR